MHIFHKWTDWEDTELYVYQSGKWVRVEGQIRHCKKCKIKETQLV